jgi:serine/threonine protein kinase
MLEGSRTMTDSGSIPVREGDLVAGKYRIERAIGAGGMGIIVAARHEQLDQRVAIKFVRGETLGNEEGVQRFLREARAAVRLRSEHAARVLDVGTLETGEPYMVMEYLEGNDLGHVLNERGPLPVEVAAEWVAQACEALAEAHAAGIVHRDLKPQNLFLSRTVGGADHVKVLDFGVSKSVESLTNGPGALTRTSAILGSPLYMAPEQMRSSRDVDARADVWALGIVLFELLTKRWPFEADTLPALCLKVVGEPPQSLSELRPDLPPVALAVIARCLEKNPQDRFANAAELASALAPLLPIGSRVLVDRARSAMNGTPATALRAGSSAPLAERPRSSNSSPGPAAPTPSAWGSGRRSAGSTRRARAAVLSIGAVAALAVALALYTTRARVASTDTPAPPAPSSPSLAAAHASPVADSRLQPAGPLPVVTLVPPPGEVATPPDPKTTGEAGATATVATARAAPVWAAPASPVAAKPASVAILGAPAGAAPAASAVPASKSPRDDDIPSLR